MDKYSTWGGLNMSQGVRQNINHSSEIAPEIRNHAVLIAQGNRRSYGDAPLGIRMVNMLKMNKIIHFDQARGEISCEAGCRLDEILSFIISKGYTLPVIPGTQLITIGGAIAADVHGKNHETKGSFCNHIVSMQVACDNGEMMECSQTVNPNLFHATCGGMGLTGIIVSAKIKLKRIANSYLWEDSHLVSSLEDGLDLFQNGTNHQSLWIANASNKVSSRFGIYKQGRPVDAADLPQRFIKQPLTYQPISTIKVPAPLPFSVVNRWSTRLISQARFLARSPHPKCLHFQESLFPLDKIGQWNYLYGRKGFVQYQSVLPESIALESFTHYFEILKSFHATSFLTVIKKFGDLSSGGWLSFPMPGYTISMDFPMSNKIPNLFAQLNKETISAGGRVYLAKDAHLTRKEFELMYGNHEKFKTFKLDHAPSFKSQLSDRIGLTTEA